MGNRAHVIFHDPKNRVISPAIYLHWNGGPESIYAFLAELKRREVRPDGEYDAARFVQIVGEFFDQDHYTGLSLGVRNGPRRITVEALAPFDHGNNGVYVIVAGKDDYTVRRFVPSYGDDRKLRELSPDEVEVERISAMAHKYNTGSDSIAGVFAKSGKLTESQLRTT